MVQCPGDTCPTYAADARILMGCGNARRDAATPSRRSDAVVQGVGEVMILRGSLSD